MKDKQKDQYKYKFNYTKKQSKTDREGNKVIQT